MKLRIYSFRDRYYFTVGGFSSMHHFFLSPKVKSSYATVWEANRDARKLQQVHAQAMEGKRYAYEDLTKNKLTPMDASAEEMMTNHYKEIFEILRERSVGQEDEPENRKIQWEEIKAVVKEILTVEENVESEKQKTELKKLVNHFRELTQEKYRDLLLKDKKEKEAADAQPDPAMPQEDMSGMGDMGMGDMGGMEQAPDMMSATAAKKFFPEVDLDIRKEMMDEYGARICSAIQNNHPKCIFKLQNDCIDICEDEPILRIAVNNTLNINDIQPCGKLREIFPLKSSKFYQRYWKPIVESVGHILLEDEGILLASKKCSFPDISLGAKDISLTGWNINEDHEGDVVLSFMDNENWSFKNGITKTAQSKFTEEELLANQPARVRCTDIKLQSIYEKYGEIKEIIPFDTHAEYDIDFGRRIVRLTEDQFELSNEIPATS